MTDRRTADAGSPSGAAILPQVTATVKRLAAKRLAGAAAGGPHRPQFGHPVFARVAVVAGTDGDLSVAFRSALASALLSPDGRLRRCRRSAGIGMSWISRPS